MWGKCMQYIEKNLNTKSMFKIDRDKTGKIHCQIKLIAFINVILEFHGSKILIYFFIFSHILN